VNERLRERIVPGMTFEATPAAAPGPRTQAPAPSARAAAWRWLALVLLASAVGLALAAGPRSRLAEAVARAGRSLRRGWRRILPPRRALLSQINPGPDS
jgi:hypothetical protein